MTTAKSAESWRDIDPNVLQRRASNPEHSAWVSASAGSGKTKVLTDRMLRLMMPRKDGTSGSRPEKILAITFTKAGANEMSLRLTDRLSQWVTASHDGLANDLEKLLGRIPTKADLTAARQLFAKVTETPGGLKIMTIHSFCQSILSRFPLEARINPQFELLDEAQQKNLLSRARESVMAEALNEKTSALAGSLHRIAGILDEDSFLKRLSDVMAEPRQLDHLKSRYFGIDGIYSSLCQSMNILPGANPEAIIRDACVDHAFDDAGLRRAVSALSQGTTSTDVPKSISIQAWLDAKPSDRISMMAAYKKAFLTNEDQIQSRLATKKPVEIYPDIVTVMTSEALRLINMLEKIKASETCLLTADILRLGDAVQTAYQDLKKRHSCLDFNDLILTTLDLLTGKTLNASTKDVTPWVMYKLDQGIDHILVDEAQDTNPEQWEIIQTLCLEFFEGHSAHEINRTVFIVGDEKQSIFGFQRAAPEKMAAMKEWFTQKISDARKSMDIIPLNVSFRTVPVVLDAVDAVMSQENIRKGLGGDVLPHIPYRRGQAGEVELWPLFTPDEEEVGDFLSPPVQITTRQSGSEKMAAYIAKRIKSWIGHEILPSRNRTVEAGDILILMRTRSAFVEKLVRALKRQNIPVSGVDRMVLSDQLVVQDLLALAQTSILPDDDLSLACILKSPFVGWNEDLLYNLAYGRGDKTLWEKLQHSDSQNIVSWIKNLKRYAGTLAPYEFFQFILNSPCPADNVSGLRALTTRLGLDMRDPLDEFLNAALEFERSNEPSLSLFIHTQSQTQQDIKRELEEAGAAVRIMTIHGAKGLQAPIVIMPDTIRSSGNTPMDRLLWPSKTGLDLPLFIPNRENIPSSVRDALLRYEEKTSEELSRLLYVAMTRAEDRLYIGGYQGKKNPAPESWYYSIKKGLESIPGTRQENFEDIEGGVTLRLSATQDKLADKIKKSVPTNIKEEMRRPDWIFKSAPEEPTPPKPMSPSRPSTYDISAATSPLYESGEMRFVRGNITHKLLQILPDLAPAGREGAAQAYVMNPAHGLSADMGKSIVAEVVAILNHPDYRELFGTDSMAEVPVTGFIAPDRMISGQIDRIVIKPHEILILDYKTNRPPPTDLSAVPLAYRQQMDTYAQAIAQIYPGRRIRTYLLWTEGARIMELPFPAP